MTFKEYEELVNPTRAYPAVQLDEQTKLSWVYPALGLSGEAGEVSEKLKKILRDKNGIVSSEDKKAIEKELGDVLWYINAIAVDIDSSLEEVAKANVTKLLDRLERNVISGSGDNR